MQKYSSILFMLLTLWIVGCGPTKQNEEADEIAVRQVAQAFQKAYNQQDANKLASYFSSDATYSNPMTGELAEGREAIAQLFKEKFADGKKKHIEIAIKRIEFPNVDQAIENGVIKVTSEEKPAREIAYRSEYTREKGTWVLASVNEIALQETSSNYEQLKELAWMVGKWKDSDDNIQITFDNHWDKYKNFLNQNFKMEIYGHDDFEGKQIIAWDPVKKVIRSWVFDSDGEFGEGIWEKIDNSWYATMRYTLNDGRTAFSKNIYTPIDDYSYIFTSIEREIDGEILPNLDPVTVKKVQ